ncbi:MAG: hypothetical protein IK093_15025 [Ruminiclostridium sp.]|nr:hypothetical protein [Ruminiclostridium sp.]
MADDNTAVKPDKKPRKPGGLLQNVLLALLDVALTVFLFVTPFCTMGAYWNYIPLVFAVGVVYVIVRIILKNIKQTRVTDRCYIVLRIVGITAAVIYWVVLFNFGDYFSWFYPIRRAVYINGNYGAEETAYFDFLPDKIPVRADKYYMHFTPPVAAPDAPDIIEIRFFTDGEGAEYMRSEALKNGGILCGTDDWTYTKVNGYCEEKGIALSGADIYMLDTPNTIKAYAISEETGFCMVLWYR